MIALAALAWADPPPEPAPADPALPSEPAPAPAPEAAPEPAPAEVPAVAPAAPPAPRPPLHDDEEVPAHEIVVYAELRAKQARGRVVQLLEDMGYTADVVDEGDRTVYRHAEAWKGEVVLWDDGWYDVKRQPVRIEGRRMPWADTDTPLAWAGCVVWPWLCIRMGGGTLGHRKWLGVARGTVEVVAGPSQEWGDRVADLATERTVTALPPRLEALWREGVPLDGGPVLATPAERRAALLAYYASRTDTVWGDAVREAIGAFVRGEVATSDTPYTPEEIAAFRAAWPDVPPPFERAGGGPAPE